MIQLQIPVTDEMYQRLQQLAQQRGQPIEAIAQAMLNASIQFEPSPQDFAESLALIDQLSGSLNIPDLDVNQHDRF